MNISIARNLQKRCIHVMAGLACMVFCGACNAYTAQDFLKYYSAVTKTMVPQLDTFGCKTSAAAMPIGKYRLECELVMRKASLVVDEKDGEFNGAKLTFDDMQFDQPGLFMEAAGMFLRVAREARANKFFSSAGHLRVASNLLQASSKNNWVKTCIDDQEADARFCVSSEGGGAIFKYTITPLSEKDR